MADWHSPLLQPSWWNIASHRSQVYILPQNFPSISQKRDSTRSAKKKLSITWSVIQGHGSHIVDMGVIVNMMGVSVGVGVRQWHFLKKGEALWAGQRLKCVSTNTCCMWAIVLWWLSDLMLKRGHWRKISLEMTIMREDIEKEIKCSREI